MQQIHGHQSSRLQRIYTSSSRILDRNTKLEDISALTKVVAFDCAVSSVLLASEDFAIRLENAWVILCADAPSETPAYLRNMTLIINWLRGNFIERIAIESIANDLVDALLQGVSDSTETILLLMRCYIELGDFVKGRSLIDQAGDLFVPPHANAEWALLLQAIALLESSSILDNTWITTISEYSLNSLRETVKPGMTLSAIAHYARICHVGHENLSHEDWLRRFAFSEPY